MSRKSRHTRKRHSLHSKKGKRKEELTVTRSRTTQIINEPVVSMTKIQVPKSPVIAAKYSHTLIELRRIGVMAGILIVILVVLAMLLN